MAEYDLMNKTELTIRKIRLRGADLARVADAVAATLGLDRGDVLVTDVVGAQVVVDVLRRGLDPHALFGKKGELQRRLSEIPGVECTPETELSSKGMLSWISLGAAEGHEILRRSEEMAEQIRRRLARTAIVFSTGAEVVAGSIKDTNAPLLRERLGAEGYSVKLGGALRDDEVLIAERLRQAADDGYGLALTTGGVGAEDKDRTIEAVLLAAPNAATREIVKYELGVGRHRHKSSVRIAVAQLANTLVVSLPGPGDEVEVGLGALLRGLAAGAGHCALASAIAEQLRARLREKNAAAGRHQGGSEAMPAERRFYDDLETMPAAERAEHLDAKARWIVEHGYRNAPGVRAKMDAAGVAPEQVRSVRDLERVPITTKDDLVRLQRQSPPFGGFATIAPNRLGTICMSPGPTYNSPGNDASYLRRVEQAFFGCGLRPGDILVNTFAYHVSPMGLLLDTPLKRFGATVIPMGGGNKQLQVQVLRDLRVTAFTGTASFLLEVLQTAEEMGVDPRKDLALRLAVTPVDHGVMRIVERDYGIRVTELYGTADVGIVAYQCAERAGMHVSEDVILEVLDLNTDRPLGPGELGRVVLTPLDPTIPLVRFAPGDLSSWTDQPCPCGRTSARLNPIAGWIGQAVKVRGMFVHPSQLAGVLAKHPDVAAYRLVCRLVDGKDRLTLRYEAGGAPPAAELEPAIALGFRDVCRLNLDAFERVPRGALGEGPAVVDERQQHEK